MKNKAEHILILQDIIRKLIHIINTDDVKDIKTIVFSTLICDKLTYLMDVSIHNISPSSDLYQLYNAWYQNINNSLNLESVMSDIITVKDRLMTELNMQ